MKYNDGMSERQAARIIETYENGAKNGEEWVHDVCLHRGTEKYERSLNILNKAFEIKYMNKMILPLPQPKNGGMRKRTR